MDKWEPRDNGDLTIPVNLDVVRRTAAGNDVHATIAVQVGRQGIFTGHAAVVDRVAVKGERDRPGFGVENEDARVLWDRSLPACSGRAGR